MTYIKTPPCPSCGNPMAFDARRNTLTCCNISKAARSWYSDAGQVRNVVFSRRGPAKMYPRRISARVTDEQGAVFDKIGQLGLRRLLDKANEILYNSV